MFAGLKVAAADVIVVGHTHVAMEVRVGGQLILNPGALLRDPAEGWERDLPAPGTLGVLELPAMTWRVLRAKTGRDVEFARRRHA